MINNALLLDLLRSETDVETEAILKDSGYWDNPDAWRPIGDNESNFGTINNQQGDPFSALTEKIVNSFDAVLVGECLRRGIDPTSPQAPQSIREAVARFIEGHTGPLRENDGRQELWGDNKSIDRTAIARRIMVVATGQRVRGKPGKPSISIVDDGEGQCPERFPDTLLSLQRGNKVKIQFVQGKWNMGGTGAIPFCSDPNRFQLIISKRDPDLLDPDASESDRHWGFTVVRKRPRRANERMAVFEYLAPVRTGNGPGAVLECDLASLPLYPSEAPDAAYGRETSHGTFIKLIEYGWETSDATRSTILQGKSLYTQVDCCLPAPPLPVRLFEGRDFESSSSAVNATGVVNRLRSQADVVEPECPIGGELVVHGQRVPVLVYVFNEESKKKRETYLAKYGVLLTVNGQKHGSFERGFFSTQAVDKSYIRDSMAAVLDCSGIDPELRDNLFMASRDRMRSNDFYESLRKELQDFLKTNDVLRFLNNRRRQQQIDKALENDAPLAAVLERLLRNSPLLAQYFRVGTNISSPFPNAGAGSAGPDAFVGKTHPTFLRFRKGSSSSLVRTVEAGKRTRLEFETDAANDYFTRQHFPGSSFVSVNSDLPSNGNWSTLHQGALSYTMGPIDSSRIGETLILTCAISDSTMATPLECVAELKVIEATRPNEPGGRGGRQSPNTGEGGQRGTGRLSIPDIKASSHLDPDNEDWTDLTAMHVNLQDGRADMFVFNRDNRFLKAAQKQSKTNPQLLEKRFEIGMALLALAYIDDLSKRPTTEIDVESTSVPVSIEDEVAKLTRALAPVLLPLVEALAEMTHDAQEDIELEN